MSLANNALLYNLGLAGFPVDDDRAANANNAQAAAAPILGPVTRCTVASAANNSFIMKSVLSGDAAPLSFLVNDSGVTINAFPAVGENNNGVANQGLAVPTGQGGIFVRVPNALGTAGWRSAVIP